jgi:hypothetical protein
MITIGSTSKGYVVGQDATALSRMNNGLRDRFKPEISTPGENKTRTPSSSSLLQEYAGPINAFNTFLKELGSFNGNTKPKLNWEAMKAFQNAAVTFYEFDQAEQTQASQVTNKNAASPNSGFLPFDLSITMDGLSGMKVYQKYIIDTEYLPSNYPNSLEFIIKGISNTIDGNQWITTLESMAIPKNPFGSSVGESTVSQASRNSSRGTQPTAGGFNVTPTLSSRDKRNIIKDYGWPILVSQPDGGTTFFGDVIASDPRNVYKRDEQYITNNVVNFTFNSQKKKGFKLTFRFHKALVDPLTKVLTQIDNAGLIEYAKDLQATIYTRDTTGSPGDLSGHAFGVAIDVNPGKFPYGKGGYAAYQAAIKNKKDPNYNYARVVETFVQSGLFNWGGNYSGTKDAHHFSVKPYNI